MSIHTPGPWKVTADERRRVWVSAKEGFDTIAQILGFERDVQLANAELIAVAPEMLELLVEFLEWGAKTSSDRFMFESRMRELIAKGSPSTVIKEAE